MSAHAAPMPRLVARRRMVDRLSDLLVAEWPRWPLWLPVALGAGVVAYFLLSHEPDPAWSLALVAPLLAAALLARRARVAAAALALLGTAGLGFAAVLWHARLAPPTPDLPRTAVVVTARIAAVDLLPEGRRLMLEGARVGDAILARHLRLRLRADDPARPVPGDTVTVRALLRAPSAPAYPGAWDFQRAAHFSGLGGSGFALGRAEVTAREDEPLFAGLRARIEARIREVVPGAPGAVAAALLTGSQSAIPPDAMAAMRDSGLAHLLSVSGLHVAIVIGLGFGMARWGIAFVPWLAVRVDGKAAAAVFGLVLGGGYTLLTGAQVPMMRAFAMAAVGTLALLTGRRVLSLRALALAAGVVLLAAPAAVLSPSFQMSFAAVLALIACAEASRRAGAALRGKGLAGRAALVLLGLVATSIVAAAATTPFGLHHFGRLQAYGVVANAVAVPLTSFVIMPAGMLALALMPFGLDGWALAAMGWGTGAVIAIGGVVASWPGAAPVAPPIPAWGVAVFTLGLCWACLWRTRWRWAGMPMMVAGLASGLTVSPPHMLVSADGRLIAAATRGGVFVERTSGGSRWTRDSWLRGWGEDESHAMPQEGEAADGAVACTPAGCTIRISAEGPAAILLRPLPRPSRREAAPPIRVEPVCGRAAVIVSAEPVRGRCREVPVVDRFAVWRDGAHAIWLGPAGVRVLSDRAARGERPWVPGVPTPRARAGDEPAAELDPG